MDRQPQKRQRTARFARLRFERSNSVESSPPPDENATVSLRPSCTHHVLVVHPSKDVIGKTKVTSSRQLWMCERPRLRGWMIAPNSLLIPKICRRQMPNRIRSGSVGSLLPHNERYREQVIRESLPQQHSEMDLESSNSPRGRGRPDTVLLWPPPEQGNGKNLCRPLGLGSSLGWRYRTGNTVFAV